MIKFFKKFKKSFDKFIWFVTGTNSNNFAYKLIAFIGLLVRIIFLPFAVTFAYKAAIANGLVNINFPTWAVELVTRAIVILSSLFFSTKLLNWMAYNTVGCFYSRGKEPVVGSIFYNVFYVLYQLMPIFLFGPFGWWGFSVSVILFLIVCGFGYGIGDNPFPKELREVEPELNKLGTYPKNWKGKTVVLFVIAIAVFVLAFFVQLRIYQA